ncbi:MAG: FHA domain-containing protein [Chloroflexota bacterium]
MYDNEPTIMGPGRPDATLVIRQGTQAGMSFAITGNQVIIGREEGLDIVLQDAESSRRHVRISWQGNQFIIEDLGSTNGTFVNGVQITSPHALNPGDSIGIGQTALVFQMSAAQQGNVAPPPTYQSPGQPPTMAPSPPIDEAEPQGNKALQYSLYGCGCLLLACVCFLLAIASWALISPETFADITGIEISSAIIHYITNAV